MDYIQQVDTVIRLLSGRKLSKDSKPFEAAIGWAGYQGEYVDSARKTLLLSTICTTFDVTENEIYAAIAGRSLPTNAPSRNGHSDNNLAADAALLEASLPSEGWLSTYISYTRQNEGPLSYHIFSSLVVLGAAIGRRVWRPKGHFNIYPNLGVLLVGPPGRVKKSTVVGIATDLVLKAKLCSVFPEKITAESLVTEINESGLQQFIAAPELSFFLGKQRYNEGLVPTLLRLLDTDDKPVRVRTVARGPEELTGVTLSMLGGSTMALLTNSTADQVAGSGFLSRLVPVVEQDTPRCFYNPPPPESYLANTLLITLDRLHQLEGEMRLDSGADSWLESWYNRRWQAMKEIEDETLAQCMNRGAVHLEKMAMLLHLADHKTFELCRLCLETAATLLDYAEARLPRIIAAINTNERSGDTEYVLEQVRRHGGAVEHSKVLRAVSSRGINAPALRMHIGTLEEQGVIKSETRGKLRFYILEAPLIGDE